MTLRLSSALLAHAEKLLANLLFFERPADGTLSAYFRVHRELGHADRGFIAETLFAILRRKRSLEARCLGQPTPRRLLLALLYHHQGISLEQLAAFITPAEGQWLAMPGPLLADPPPDLSAAVVAEMPDWLHARLAAQWQQEDLAALLAALMQPAPLDLRINPLKISRENALRQLAADHIRAEAGAWSPWAIRLAGKPAINRKPLFLQGEIEVQDEGSQLLGFLLEARRGEMVVDFCAGAGGKTLLLGALMKNTGRLYAFDVSDKRLAHLKPRLARSGLSNVHPVRIENERDTRVKRLAGKVDRVLVDAPCSGLGTLRRNPDLKWRQSEAAIAELCAKQADILASAARLPRSGGRLVYATCSLLREENEAVVDAFLASHPEYERLSAGDVLAGQGIPDPGFAGPDLCLLPHRHKTDAFFAAVLQKK